MSTQNTYTASAANLGYSALPTNVASGYYALQAPVVVAATATVPAAFTISALPVTGKGQDRDTSCAVFKVDSSGRQSSTDSSNADSTATCWN